VVDTPVEPVDGVPDGAPDSAPDGVRQRHPVFENLQVFNARRMPTLDFVNDRFVKAAKETLYSLIRRPVEVSAQPAQVKPYAELMNAGTGRPHITIGKVHPLKGSGAWVVSAALVYMMVDTMFGGDSRVPPRLEERDLSATELRILRRMMDGLVVEYEKAWQPVHELRFEYVREESDFKRADIASPDDMVLHNSFVITINGHQAQLDFCVPYWALDSLKSVLFEPTRNLQVEIDSHWTGRLENEVQSAEVDLVAVLAKEEMRIADVLALNVGDIVPIEVLEPITAYVDGLPMVLGQYGVRNGRYAIKVQHVKNPADLVGLAKKRGRSS
jgi:flagellar motor switch protein FliM